MFGTATTVSIRPFLKYPLKTRSASAEVAGMDKISKAKRERIGNRAA
jgi:hypothetical protein